MANNLSLGIFGWDKSKTESAQPALLGSETQTDFVMPTFHLDDGVTVTLGEPQRKFEREMLYQQGMAIAPELNTTQAVQSVKKEPEGRANWQKQFVEAAEKGNLDLILPLLTNPESWSWEVKTGIRPLQFLKECAKNFIRFRNFNELVECLYGKKALSFAHLTDQERVEVIKAFYTLQYEAPMGTGPISGRPCKDIPRFTQEEFPRDLTIRIELALWAIENDTHKQLFYPDSHGFIKEPDVIEIFKRLAHLPFSRSLGLVYFIKDERARAEIVLIAAKYQSDLSQRMSHHCIHDEKARVEIAMVAAQHFGSQTSEFIQNYRISSEKVRAEVAKVAVKGHKDAVKFIGNYDIDDQQLLVEIATIAAQNGGVAKHIREFGIEEEQTLVNIAKLEAARNGRHTAKHFLNYGIHRVQDRLDIAKIIGGDAIEFIDNFHIRQEAARIELAKAATEKDPRNVNLPLLGIKNRESLNAIIQIAARKMGPAIFVTKFASCMENYGQEFYEAIFLQGDPFKFSYTLLGPHVANFECEHTLLHDLTTGAYNEKVVNWEIQRMVCRWAMGHQVIGDCLLRKLKEKNIHAKEELHHFFLLVKELYDNELRKHYENNSIEEMIRLNLVTLLAQQFYRNPELLAVWHNLAPKIAVKTLIPLALVFTLTDQEKALHLFADQMNGRAKELNDPTTLSLLRTYLMQLNTLSIALSPNQRRDALLQVFHDSENCADRLRALLFILNEKKAELIAVPNVLSYSELTQLQVKVMRSK